MSDLLIPSYRSGRSPKMRNHERFAQVAHQNWANEQIACFLSESLIRSFFRKRRAICSENRWANSQPWEKVRLCTVHWRRIPAILQIVNIIKFVAIGRREGWGGVVVGNTGWGVGWGWGRQARKNSPSSLSNLCPGENNSPLPGEKSPLPRHFAGLKPPNPKSTLEKIRENWIQWIFAEGMEWK